MSRLLGFFEFLGLRGWLFLLVACSTLPLTGALLWSAVETRDVMTRDAVQAMNERLVRASALFESEVSKLLGLLDAVSRDRQLLSVSPEDCDARIARIARIRGDFTPLSGLFIFDVDGTMLCGYPPLSEAVNVGDRDYFLTARESQGPVLGKPTLGRVTGRPILPFATWLPADEHDRNPRYGIAGRVDLDELLDRLSLGLGLPLLQLTLWNANGILVGNASTPGLDDDRRRPPPDLVMSLMADPRRQGVISTRHADRSHLAYAFIKIELASGPLWLVADAPIGEIFNAVHLIFYRTLIASTLITVIAMTLGLVMAQLALRAPILRIAATTHALERRYLASRVGRIHGVRELVDLARHVDHLAEAIERQQRSRLGPNDLS
ncbi:hypothetical protein SAMN07250955_101410 [Arboricoccus pini]|uniref:HAMP domain-containing protein n=1 Tax=Arboricoccus pini TaxID=1963835 RepID=A0A212Q4E8_9PROT|nr:hypothetical protein [Arboricoccus pini]SNB54235.1 hypothetical protein SAMN07250955_101410 [Arboricoccus pini]